MLIPARLESDVLTLMQLHGGLRGLLGLLLRRHGMKARQVALTLPQRITTRYQSQGQDLQKRHFRAVGHEWAWVKCLAHASGVSICMLVIIMIQLELAETPADQDRDGTLLPWRRVEHREWVNLERQALYRVGRLHKNAPAGGKRAKRRSRAA